VSRLRGGRVDDRCLARPTTRSSGRAGRSRSPTPTRSGALLLWPARPTRPTRWCWRPSASETWCRRSGCRVPTFARTAGPLSPSPGKAPLGAQAPHRSTLINLGAAPSRRLLARLDVPEPWRSNVAASVALIDDPERQIGEINGRLRASHADHPYRLGAGRVAEPEDHLGEGDRFGAGAAAVDPVGGAAAASRGPPPLSASAVRTGALPGADRLLAY
jgi:hypothetical protein